MKTRWLIFPGAGGLLFWFLADAQTVRDSVSEALTLCGASVIPALFPFLVVSGLFLSSGCGEWTAPLFSGFMTPLYRLPGQAGSALVLGFLGGHPVGARTAADLYRKGLVSKEEAERLLGFCNNANPAFFINVLGAGVFGSTRTGIRLMLIHIASALLTGLFFRGNVSGPRRENVSGFTETGHSGLIPEETSVFSLFVEAVGNAAFAVIRICAFVVFFYVLVTPLRKIPGRPGMILTGFVELFSLTPLLSRDTFGLIAVSALCGWGGCGVLCQTAAALDGSGLSIRNCVLGKAVQGIIAGVLATVMILL